jgi:hypothetical protein
MLRGILRWTAYLVLTAIVVLVVLSLTGQMGVVRELKEHVAIAQKAGMPHVYLQEMIRVHRRFTGLLILSISGFLLLMTGILTVMQHTREGFKNAGDQDKLEISLKKTSPAVMMLLVGTLALAIAHYGYSYLEHRYSSIMSRMYENMPKKPDAPVK